MEKTTEKSGKRISYPDKVFANFLLGKERLFEEIRKDLLGANMPVLVRNYISRTLFFTLISALLGIALGVLTFVLIKNILISLALIFFIPSTVFILFYSYPAMLKSSTGKRIDEELPFATIYMAAISSSDLEPTKMFRLIANSNEYPSIGIEMKKVVNQIDLYGYNLATALTNVAQDTKSERLSELYSGIAVNITSGGSLKNYLEKKAENLLTDYKLDRQKYNSLAETFMDIYISLLITAPLILMIVFVVMNMTGFEIGISMIAMNLIVITLIAILNIIFLSVLHLKQPKN
jgi:flagellar protein FlaJ